MREKRKLFRPHFCRNLELTQNTPAFVKGYAALAHNEQLNDLVADNQALQELVQRTPIVDVLHKFPAKLTAEQLVSLLRPLTPRLYSISSSPAEVGEEVHLPLAWYVLNMKVEHVVAQPQAF